jgi:CheY-like chemotaxis protein
MDRLDDTSVLIVDDDEETLSLYVRALEKMGARVSAARDAASALTQLDAARPDIVLCDLHLPGTDGYELLEQMRASANGADLPVVAISGSHPALEAERCKAAGFRDHLTKPVKLDVIVSTIHRYGHVAR